MRGRRRRRRRRRGIVSSRGSEIRAPQLHRAARRRPLQTAGLFWRMLELPRDWSIPGWYHNLYGTSPWFTSRKTSSPKTTSRMRALAFIVRMNYIMDTDLLTTKVRLPGCISRRLDILNLRYSEGCLGPRSNVTWAHSRTYDWRRVLCCTLKNFVNLAYPLLANRFRTVSSIG